MIGRDGQPLTLERRALFYLTTGEFSFDREELRLLVRDLLASHFRMKSALYRARRTAVLDETLATLITRALDEQTQQETSP